MASDEGGSPSEASHGLNLSSFWVLLFLWSPLVLRNEGQLFAVHLIYGISVIHSVAEGFKLRVKTHFIPERSSVISERGAQRKQRKVTEKVNLSCFQASRLLCQLLANLPGVEFFLYNGPSLKNCVLRHFVLLYLFNIVIHLNLISSSSNLYKTGLISPNWMLFWNTVTRCTSFAVWYSDFS